MRLLGGMCLMSCTKRDEPSLSARIRKSGRALHRLFSSPCWIAASRAETEAAMTRRLAARTLNDQHRSRVILLTARELEPYSIYERTKTEFSIRGYGSTAEDLAQTTAQIYFNEQPPA